jgi:hypothetical protein
MKIIFFFNIYVYQLLIDIGECIEKRRSGEEHAVANTIVTLELGIIPGISVMKGVVPVTARM